MSSFSDGMIVREEKIFSGNDDQVFRLHEVVRVAKKDVYKKT